MTRLLVTGATGFVGAALIRRLREEGRPVRAAVRKDVALQGVETVRVGDVGPRTDWSEALSGVDAVIHLAARVHVMDETALDPVAAFRTTNVVGTQVLAQAAAAAGVRRFISVSSVKAMVDEDIEHVLTESQAPSPTSAYGVSKLEGERALVEAAAGQMEWVIVRPPLVYGPAVGGNFGRLMRHAMAGLPFPFGSVRNRRSMIFVENLASALCLCVGHPDAAGGTFLVQDGGPLSTAELYGMICEELGRPNRSMPVPPALLKTGARMLRREGLLRRLAGSLEVDDRLIRARLGWTPPVSVRTGIRETCLAFLAQSRVGAVRPP